MTVSGGPAMIELPAPCLSSNVAVETALLERRSVRSFTGEPLCLSDVSQILWAAQGITGPYGQRTAPSAGALYPLECYLAAGRVDGLPPGVYKYQSQNHALVLQAEGDVRRELSEAALNQPSLVAAPAVVVLAAEFDRTAWKYGQMADRYIYIEIGHVAQNIALQAVSLQLGSVVIGAFDEAQIKKLLHIAPNEEPLYLIPLGKGREA